MNYKNVKYLILLIFTVAAFLIWFLFFEAAKKSPVNNPEIKKEVNNPAQEKNILSGKRLKRENTLPTEEKVRIKNQYKKIKSENKNKQTRITYSDNKLLIKDTLAVRDTAATNESEKEYIVDNINATRTPPAIAEIPEQIISWGQKFSNIDLNQFVLDEIDDPHDIKWQFNGNKNLNFSISDENRLKVILPDEDWYGTDTLQLVAVNSANLSSSAKIVFEIQEPDLINRNPVKPVKDILVTGVEDVLSFTLNPLEWESDDFIKAAAIVGGTFLLTRADYKIREGLVGNSNYQNNTLMNIGKFYGKTSTSQYTSIGITLLGLSTGNKKITRLGLEVFETFLIADRITYILKYAFGRDRPSANNGALNFNPFPGRENNINSLPSGHATNAFALSTVLSSYTDNLYLKIIIYSPAFITAISRVYQNYHWTSDVFLGGTIGYLVGSFLVNRHNKILSDKVSFIIDGQGRIGIVYKF